MSYMACVGFFLLDKLYYDDGMKLNQIQAILKDW